MDSLKNAVRTEMKKYAVKGFFGEDAYMTSDDDQQTHVVVSISEEAGKRVVEAFLVSRIVGDRVIIEQDLNDKPLVDALVQAGVPREKIVLAYAGEKIPQ